MSREWQPGDVAMVKVHVGHQETRVARGFDNRWHGQDGIYRLATDARPVVVIDPEDREQVTLLNELIQIQPQSDTRPLVDVLRDALREFANPKPPKPVEPTGLGAVVEDEDGSLHVRTSGHIVNPWRSETDGSSRSWSLVAAVRVLSAGVSS